MENNYSQIHDIDQFFYSDDQSNFATEVELYNINYQKSQSPFTQKQQIIDNSKKIKKQKNTQLTSQLREEVLKQFQMENIPFCKKEFQKRVQTLRNKISAQKSRDNKKELYQQIENENRILKLKIEQLEQIIENCQCKSQSIITINQQNLNQFSSGKMSLYFISVISIISFICIVSQNQQQTNQTRILQSQLPDKCFQINKSDCQIDNNQRLIQIGQKQLYIQYSKALVEQSYWQNIVAEFEQKIKNYKNFLPTQEKQIHLNDLIKVDSQQIFCSNPFIQGFNRKEIKNGELIQLYWPSQNLTEFEVIDGQVITRQRNIQASILNELVCQSQINVLL